MHYVRIIDSRIAELDTGSQHCNIVLPDELIGTHLSKYIYENGQFNIDPNWTEPVEEPPELP